MPEGAARRAQNVIDLTEWRAARPEPLPESVLAEMEAAGRVYEALLAQGYELRFEVPGASSTGPVRAELRAVGGGIIRDVTLGEVLGLEDSPAA